MMEKSEAVPLPTRDGYDAWAPLYDEDDNPLIKLEAPVVAELLPDLAGQLILDVGCGTGRHSLVMAAAGADVTAIDFSEEMLALARQKPGADRVRFIQHDIHSNWPFENQHFDLVTCFLVSEHIDPLEGFFGEMARVCKPGGIVLNTCMHPAMFERGVMARFIDPVSGVRKHIDSCGHTVGDYRTAAEGAGLVVDHLEEYLADEALAAISPRAERYIGVPMLLVMKLHPA